jgi:hypothetical protein
MARGPSASDHHQQAQVFESFYTHLGGSGSAWPQWAAVALFYTAVHEVLGFLVARRVWTHDHTSRKQVLAQQHRPLDSLYSGLSDLSRKARYECITPSSLQLTMAEAQLAMIRQHIAQQPGPQPPY